MRRKQLTPSVVRRCAVFLALGGALALGMGRAEGGIAPVESPDDQVGMAGFDQLSVVRPDVQESGGVEAESVRSVGSLPAATSKARLESPTVSPDDLAGPGLTGANWFQGLQQGVDQAFEPNQMTAAAPNARKNGAASPLNAGVKANAIPSLPSFWSGLTCCLAVAGAGMIPRVRRAFLR
jgi:hypothetical protein